MRSGTPHPAERRARAILRTEAAPHTDPKDVIFAEQGRTTCDTRACKVREWLRERNLCRRGERSQKRLGAVSPASSPHKGAKTVEKQEVSHRMCQ